MELILLKNEEKSFHYKLGTLLMNADMLPIQAEQCILIAENTGKCVIKSGTIDELLELKASLSLRLNVELK